MAAAGDSWKIRQRRKQNILNKYERSEKVPNRNVEKCIFIALGKG